MKSYSEEAAKELLKKIKEQFSVGHLIIDNDRDDNNDRYTLLNYNGVEYPDCKELTNYYRDNQGNLAYKVVRLKHKTKGLDLCDIEEYENGFLG